MTPLDAAIELEGLPAFAPQFASSPSLTSEAPTSRPTLPPRESVASFPGDQAPAARRLAPWIAIAAIAGIGIGLVGRGAVGRDPARGTAVAAPLAAPPGAAAAAVPATVIAPGTAVEAHDERGAVAGAAETSAISRPSGTWRMPAPTAPGTSAAAPAPGSSAAATPAAEGERPPEETPTGTAPADAAAGPEDPGADNLANPYPAPSSAPAAEGAEGEAAPAPTSDVPFDRGAAMVALATATAAAAGCRKDDAPTGTTRVAVTFAPSGRVTQATVSGAPYAGTPTGGCIAQAFRGVSIGPFQGDPVTVTKSVSIR